MSASSDESIIQGIFGDSPSWHPDDGAAKAMASTTDVDLDDFSSTDADDILGDKPVPEHVEASRRNSALLAASGPQARDVVFDDAYAGAAQTAYANASGMPELATAGYDTSIAAGTQAYSRSLYGNGTIPSGEGAHGVKKRHRGKTALWITLASIVGVLLIAYIVGVFFFLSHMGFDTTITYDGVSYDCSFMTVSQIQDKQRELVSGYQLAVNQRSLPTEYIDGSDIDLTYEPDSQLSDILDSQNPFLFFTRVYRKFFTSGNSDYDLQPSVKFDAAKLESIVDSLACMQVANQTDPVNATPVYDSTQAKYVVQPEQLGTAVVEEAAQEVISAAVSGGQTELDLGDTDAYKAPSITTTTQSLLDQVDTYNQYLRFSITYQAGSKTLVLDATTAESWLAYNDDGTVSLNQDSVRSWVENTLSPTFDTLNTSRTFVGGDGGTYTISGGNYGWSVDQDAEVDAINTAFANQTGETREPNWYLTAASFDGNDFGNTFIECNISTQTMYVIQDGAVIFSALVVTGSPDGTHDTPTGVWSILDKKSPYVMHGDQHEDGSYEYTSPCTYWMRVTWTGVGFHDATWQPWFGGDRYTYAGSHGCINMSLTDAGSLWNLVYVGEPVLIHF